MTDPYANARFSVIKTRAVRQDGKVIHGYYSFPNGATKAEYDRIDAQLCKLYGNEGSRTEGTFHDTLGTHALKSEQSRRTDALHPLPCIVCGTQLMSAANDPSFDHVPYAGTMFHTSGHYGSTAFDSFDGFQLQIVVCDGCLRNRAGEHVRLRAPTGEMVPWDGVSDEMPSAQKE